MKLTVTNCSIGLNLNHPDLVLFDIRAVLNLSKLKLNVFTLSCGLLDDLVFLKQACNTDPIPNWTVKNLSADGTSS